MQILKEDNLIQELNYEGLFDEFYTDYLLCFEDYLHNVFKETHLIWEEETAAKVDLLCYLKGCLCDISVRTLIFDMNEYRENIVFEKEDSKAVYEHYCQELMSERKDWILKKYPMLKYLIEKKIESVECMLTEILTRLEKDMHQIKTDFLIDTSIITGIELGSGDTHNHGKTVAIVNFASGKKVVYKPRSLQPELAYGTLCDWINEREYKDQLLYVASLDKKTYGWQAFVERKECKSLKEVKSYFRRMGKNIALFYLMNATDFHGENIIPSGACPYFVDLETLVTAQPKKKDTTSLLMCVQNIFTNSVMTSAILPMATKNAMLDVDLSGLGARPGQKSSNLKYQEIINKGTSDIRYEERLFVTNNMDNSVILNGEMVDYIHYVDDIEAGFDQVYRLLMREKVSVKSELDKVLNGGYYRQVLRGTYIYEKFLNAALSPKYLMHEKDREKVLLIINSNHTKKGEYEVLQMMENDVPYFMVDYTSTALYTVDSVVDKHYSHKSLREQVSEKVDGLSEKDLLRQISFIRNSIVLAKEDIMKVDAFIEQKEQLEYKGTSQEAVLSTIINRIEDYAIWNKEHSACSFLDVALEKKASIGLISDQIYQGLGLVWFLFAYADYTKKKKDIEFAEAALRGMEEIYKEEKYTLSTSAFCGYFSYIYFYSNLYQLTKREEFAQKSEKLLHCIREYNFEKEPITDIIGGVAGAILVMYHIQKQNSREEYNELIEKYADFLARKCDEEEKKLTGFAHGMAGYAVALRLAGEQLKKERFIDKAEELQKKEDQFFVDSMRNWRDLREGEEDCKMFWCHGAPGILLGRSYYMNSDIFMEKYQSVIEYIIEDIKNGDAGDSMCHGKTGNLDILLTIAKNTKDVHLKKCVEEMYQEFVVKITKEGVEYGIPQVKGITSFMLGLSGIGYGILRNLNPQLPCILALETYGGEKDEGI